MILTSFVTPLPMFNAPFLSQLVRNRQQVHGRCVMYAGGCALCARDAGGYAPCTAAEVLEVSEVMRCVLLRMLGALEGLLCLLEALEGMHRVLLSMLGSRGGSALF